MRNKLFNFIKNLRVFEKRQRKRHHLIIIDGPTAIPIAKQLADSGQEVALRFMPSVHYLTLLDQATPSLKKNLVGWQLSSLLIALYRYVSTKYWSLQQTGDIKLTALLNRQCLGHYIEKNAPLISSVIVFNERNPPAAFAISTAKKWAIETACIQHGAVVENYFPMHVDRYYTWSAYYSDLLQRRTPGLKTVCVGRLGYQLPVLAKIPRSNKPLLVLQPANVSIKESVLLAHFKTVIDVCYRFFDEIALRPHPSDNILPDIVDYIGNRTFIIDSGDLAVALSSYTITLSLYSTVLYEAPLFGSVPIQYLESAFGGELMSRCELQADCQQQLHEILNGLQQQAFFDESLLCAKNYSAERMTFGDNQALFEALKQQS